MARKTSIGKTIFNAAIFICLEIAALSMLQNSSEVQNSWIASYANSFNACIWGSADRISSYFGLRKINDSLAVENYRLRRQLEAIDSSWTFSEDLEMSGNFYTIPAKIVRHNSNSRHNVLLLDKGSLDNVTAGSGVITDKGVIGTIDAVSEHYAHVISFCNVNSVVSARLGRDGSVGPLRWDGVSRKGAILSEIPPVENIQPGDTVYTSGFSSIFPADIPLGITRESKLVNGATLNITVELFEDIQKVRYVSIASNNDLVEIMELLETEHLSEEMNR